MRPSSDPTPRAARAALPLVALACALFAAAPAWAAPQVDQNAGTWTDNLGDNAGLATNLPESFGTVYKPLTRLVTLSDTASLACRQTPCAADEAPGKYGQLVTTPIAPVSSAGWGRAYLKLSASQRPELMAPAPADVEVRFLGNNGTTYGPFQLIASDDTQWSAMVDLSTVPTAVTSGRLLVHLREKVIVVGVRDDDAGRPVGDAPDIRILPTYQGAKVTWSSRSVVNVAVSAPATICSNAPFNVRVRVAVSLVNAQDVIVYVPLVTPAADAFGLTYPLSFSKATDNGKYTESGTVIRGVTIPARSVYWEFGTRNAGNTWVVSYDVTPPAGTLNGTLYSATAQARSLNALAATSLVPAETSVQSAPAPTVKLTAAVEGECLVGGEIPGDARRLTYTLTTANQPASTCSEHYHRAVLYQDLADLVTPTEGTAFGSVFTGAPPAAFALSAGGQYTAGGTSLNGVVIPPNSVYWDLGTLDVGESQTRTISMDLKATTRFGGPIPVGHVAESTAVIRSGVRAQTASSDSDVGFGYSGFGGISYHYSEQIRQAIASTPNVNDNASLSLGYGDLVNYGLVVANESANTLVDTVLIQKIPAGASLAAALSTSSSYVVRYNLGGAANADDVPPDFTRATHAFGPSWTTTPPSDLTTVNWVAVDVPFITSDVPDECTGTSLGGGSDINVRVSLVIDPPVNGCAEALITSRGLFHTKGVLFPGDATATPIPDTGTWALSDLERVAIKPVLPGLSAMSVSASPSALVGPGQVTFNVAVPNNAVGAAQTDTARDVVVTLNMPRMSINGVVQALTFASVKAEGGVIDYSAQPDQLIVRYATIAPLATRQIQLVVNVPSGFVSGHNVALAVQATAQDDVCGQVTGSASRSVLATGNPYLEVKKTANLGVGARGSELEYALSYTNKGETVSTGSWIVDQVPSAVSLVSASPVPNGGQVWFSSQAAPILPTSLRAASPVFTLALIQANFVQGVPDGQGQLVPPAGFGRVTWVAFRVDDGALTPPLLKTEATSKVYWTASVSNTALLGGVILNEAAIFSSELLPAISNEANTIVSDDPSLDVSRTCPDVTSAGDELTYRIAWVNNSTNDDYQVRFIETLPDLVAFVGASHTWNTAAQDDFGGVDVQPVWDNGARTLTWDVSQAIDPSGATPIGSFIGGELEITVRVAPGTPTGTFAELSGLATATNLAETMPLALTTGCAVFVENPDLYVRIGIDQPEPVSGETVNYTVIASNMGANLADDTSLVVTLPLGVSYADGPGGVSIFASPGWAFDGTSEPALTLDAEGREVLTWSLATNNALSRSGLPVGRFPARSGPVNLAFPALVAPSVAPNTTLTATAVIATPAAEDDVYPNTHSVTAVTPLPDPKVDKSGPAFAKPGASITYRLQYSNESRQPAPAVFLVDRLWDDAPADGQADVALNGVTVANGEVVYYHDAPLTGLEPAFNPADPAATGWRTVIGASPVNWIGLYRETLAGNAGPYSVYIDVALRHPVTGQEPQAGATIVNRATIRIPDGFTPDKDKTNNIDEVKTQTPGVDIGAELACDPVGGYPGTSPGAEVGAKLTLRNQGTTRAYGLKLDWVPASWFELVSDDSATLVVETDAGTPTSALDQNGNPITAGLSWTRTATGFVLGDLDESSPRYYRKVGIPAGAKLTLTLRGRVAADVAHDTIVAHELAVTTDYRFDFDAQNDVLEEITLNNTTSCDTTVYRADPMVLKTASGVDASEPYTAGQQIEYDIAYNNLGGAPAAGVFIEDYLPAGTGFVVGSLSNAPAGTTVAYDDGSGTFTYAPSGAVGAVDRDIKAFRILWDEALPAPAGATFTQETRFDFEDGTFTNTRVSDDGESVIVTGVAGNTGSYTTPPIPTDPTATVLEWGRIVVDGLVEDPANSFSVAVLDAATDAVIAEGLVPDPSGAIELELDAGLHPRIRLRVDFPTSPLTCVFDPLPESGTATTSGDAVIADNYSSSPVVYALQPSGAMERRPMDVLADSPTSEYLIQWVSPDHRFAAGQTLRNDSVVHLYWELDTNAGRYRVRELPGAGSTRFRGGITSARSEVALEGRSAPATNSGTVDNYQRVNGVWFYTPTAAQPLTWVANVIPGISQFEKNITLLGAGADFVVVEYTDSAWSPEAAIVTSDSSAPSGLRVSAVPRPAGLTTSWFPGGSFDPRESVFTGFLFEGSRYDEEQWLRGGFLWGRDGQGVWQIQRLNATNVEGSGGPVSRRRFGPRSLPLVEIALDSEANGRWAQPTFSLAGAPYGTMPFHVYNGPGPNFTPWAAPNGYDVIVPGIDGDLSPFEEGVVPVLFQVSALPPGVENLYGYAILGEDGVWHPVFLPTLEEGGGEQAFVLSAAPGPVLYGWSLRSGRGPKMVAWHFPDGDVTRPVAVDLSAALRATDPLTGEEVSLSCEYNWLGRGGIKPDSEGFASLLLRCTNGGRTAYAFIDPGPSGIEVAVTPFESRLGVVDTNLGSSVMLTTAQSDGQTPALIRCGRTSGGVALESTQVVYRTDKNPSFQYRVEVDDVCQVGVTNTARVYTSSAQITEANDESTVTSDIETTDLGVEVTADRGSVLAGQAITYTATVTNRGPGIARGVEVTLDWPTGSGVGGTQEVQVIESLRPGEVRTFTETVTVTAAEANIRLDAAASVTTSTIDCDLGDDLSFASALTGELPNVAVTLTGPATWQVGDTAEYVATAFNNGTVTANDVVLTVTIPPYGTLQQVLVEGDGLDVTCTQSAQLVTCDIASLQPLDQGGVPAVITLVLVNPSCEDAGGAFEVDATVDAALDANSADNTADTSTTILGAPGALALVATPSRSTVRTGETLTWFLHYQNDGTEAVAGATLTASVPAGTTLDATGTTPGYTVNGSTVSWGLPTLAARRGGTIALSVNVTGAAPMALTGLAGIAVPEGSNACEVEASLSGAVIVDAGVHITKRASTYVGCGEPIEWLITVTNDGATDLTNITITDSVPAESPYLGGSIAGEGAAVLGPQQLGWAIAELAAGASVTVGFSSQAPSSSGVLVSNVATVSQGGQTLGTSAPATVWATCNGATLEVTKSWAHGCALEGESVEVVVTAKNTSGSSIAAVLVSDPLPAGLTFSASTTGATLDVATGNVTQQAATLLPGQTLTVRYTATVSGAAGEIMLGAATATGTGVQPQVSNLVGAAILDCDDGLECTVDTCDAILGCVNTPPDLPETVCDGLDDNCNGQIDEELTRTVTCGLGACQGNSVVEICTAGEWSGPECDAFAGATTETCNNVDEDCDGVVDDEITTTTEVCVMAGGCPGVLTIGCLGGTMQALGECALSGTITDGCDGVDEDCDGQTDEDFVSEPAPCGEDACGSATGVTTCECGEPGVACDPAWTVIPDTSCGESDGAVAYAIVYDSDRVARGTIRCTQSPQGLVGCDEDPEAPGQFKVYPELWCPGVSPPPEPKECLAPGWSKAFGPSPDWIEPYGMSTDASGNIYVTGYMSDAVDLGGGVLTPALGETTWDLFYAKYTPAGDHVWSRRVNALSTSGGSQGTGMSAGAAGELYLTAQVYAGAFEIGGQVVSSTAGAMVVMKLDGQGEPLWIRSFEGLGTWQQPIVVDAAGGIYVASRYGTADVDLGDGPLPYTGSWGTVALARLDASGEPVWSLGLAAVGGQVYNPKLSLGPSGSIILGGIFSGELTIGADTLVAEGQDAFVAMFAADGTPLWSRKLGAAFEDYLVAVGVTPGGEIVCVGNFENTTTWGGPTLTSPLERSAVMARFSATGEHLASHLIATAAGGRIWVEAASVGAGGDIALIGAFESVAEVGGVTLTSASGAWDTFVASVREDGTAAWAISSQVGPHPENSWDPDGWGYNVATSPNGAVIGSGYIIGQADFGFGPFVSGGEGASMFLLSVPPGGPQ